LIDKRHFAALLSDKIKRYLPLYLKRKAKQTYTKVDRKKVFGKEGKRERGKG